MTIIVSLPETTDPGEDQETTRPEDNTDQTRKNTPGTVDTKAVIVNKDEEVTVGEGKGPTILVLAKRS